MKDTFLKIMEKGDKEVLIAFLQSLHEEQKAELVPVIEERRSYYLINIWGNEEIRERSELIGNAVFVCFPYKTWKEMRIWDMPAPNDLTPILSWYCPSWFSDFINEKGRNEYWDFSYDILMDWTMNGYLSPSLELIIEWLPYTVASSRRGERKYQLDGLVKYPVSCEEHIWYLFQYPSQIHKVNSWYIENSGKNGNSWERAFLELIEKGKIERDRVLRETLKAITPELNKHQAGFFAGLFQAFQPTKEELLTNQELLLELVYSTHSKPVSIALKYVKQICLHPDFHTLQFVEQLPALLSKEGKSILLSVLEIAGKVMEKNKEYIPDILSALPIAFLNKDEAVQKSAAKLLMEFAKPNESLCEELRSVDTTILMSVRPLLKDFLQDKPLASTQVETKEKPVFKREQLSAENRISGIDTLEDLAFHLNHTFELKCASDFDCAINALVRLSYQVKEEDFVLFEPVLKKAYKVYIEHRNWTDFRYVYAVCLIQYGDYLQQRYPGSLSFLNKLKESALEASEKFATYQYKEYFVAFEPLNKIPVDNPETDVFLKLVIHVLDKIKKEERLPLLSTPTHYPAWIDPVVLVDRISVYQQQNVSINELDFQLAIQRCALGQVEEAVLLIPDKLTGEPANLMTYFLKGDQKPEGVETLFSCWVTAGIIRKGTLEEEWKDSIYKRIPEEYISGIHPIEMKTTGRGSNPFIVRFTNELYNPKDEPERLWMEYNGLQILSEFVEPMILSYPNRPANVYRNIIQKITRWGDVWEVEEVKTMLLALRLMRELENPYGEMEYVMLAVALLSKNKDIYNLGCQIWIDGVDRGTIDNKKLGVVIGIIEAKDVYPIKRFADMIQNSISQLGTKYIPALYELTETVLSQLPENPIRNLKKVLEVYRELLLLTSRKVNKEFIPQLSSWIKENSLKKVVVDLK